MAPPVRLLATLFVVGCVGEVDREDDFARNFSYEGEFCNNNVALIARGLFAVHKGKRGCPKLAFVFTEEARNSKGAIIYDNDGLEGDDRMWLWVSTQGEFTTTAVRTLTQVNFDKQAGTISGMMAFSGAMILGTGEFTGPLQEDGSINPDNFTGLELNLDYHIGDSVEPPWHDLGSLTLKRVDDIDGISADDPPDTDADDGSDGTDSDTDADDETSDPDDNGDDTQPPLDDTGSITVARDP